MARPGFNFRYQEKYLTAAEQLVLVTECRKRFPATLPYHKRLKLVFGVKGGSFTVVFRGNPVTYHFLDWEDFPELRDLAKRIGYSQDYCVVQYYPHGGVGIKPHRDKEITPGTPITGISLGWKYVLEMSRPGTEPYQQSLASGSRYDFLPPTNDLYAHAILPTAEPAGERWSLTFRKAPEATGTN